MKRFSIYLGGIGGVGKTEIGKKLARRHHAKHFSGSRIMMRLCKVDSREKLSKIGKKRKLLLEKVEYPKLINRYSRVIVDGHCQLLPEQARCFKKFIFLKAPAKTILLRRKVRGRRDGAVETIMTELKEYRQRVLKTERLCNIKFITISNSGIIDETCKLIENAIKK